MKSLIPSATFCSRGDELEETVSGSAGGFSRRDRKELLRQRTAEGQSAEEGFSCLRVQTLQSVIVNIKKKKILKDNWSLLHNENLDDKVTWYAFEQIR